VQCSARCPWCRHRYRGRAAATAALLGLLVVALSAPTPAAPLLYVNTSGSLQVIDADTGRLGKKIFPPGDSLLGPQVAAGGRLYLAAAAAMEGAAPSSLLVVDPDRNVAAMLVQNLPLINNAPFVGGLHAAADGAALYFLSGGTDTLGRLDLVQGVVSTIKSAAFGGRSGCGSQEGTHVVCSVQHLGEPRPPGPRLADDRERFLRRIFRRHEGIGLARLSGRAAPGCSPHVTRAPSCSRPTPLRGRSRPRPVHLEDVGAGEVASSSSSAFASTRSRVSKPSVNQP